MGEDAITVTGMVLSAIPIGDYDKRLTILTREMGKIQVFARGAKRPKSSFVAAANPFVYGTFTLHAGKNYNLAKVSVKRYFEEFSANLDALLYGSYFLEVAGAYCVEGQESEELLKLLYVSAAALLKGLVPFPLIRRIFEWKVLVLNGEYPDVTTCAICKSRENIAYFHTAQNGVVCADHKAPLGSIPILPGAVYALDFVMHAPVEKCYSFTLSEEVLPNFCDVVRDYFTARSDRHFKSEAMLEKGL